MDDFTRIETSRLTHLICQPSKWTDGCSGWLLLRMPPELHIEASDLVTEWRLYAQVPVAKLVMDSWLP